MIHKKSWFLLSVLAFAGWLAGCAAQGNPGHQNGHSQGMEMPQKLTIEFSTDPNPVTAGQPARLIERVTQNGQPVADATVEMEIWRDGDAQRETVPATADQKGTYIVQKTFDQAGVYHVTLHTTARGIHQMPTKEFRVEPAK